MRFETKKVENHRSTDQHHRDNYSEEPSRNISESRVEIAIRDCTGSPSPSDSSTFNIGTEINRTVDTNERELLLANRYFAPPIHLKLIDSNFKRIEPFFLLRKYVTNGNNIIIVFQETQNFSYLI